MNLMYNDDNTTAFEEEHAYDEWNKYCAGTWKTMEEHYDWITGDDKFN
jgi:hypothetical protein